MSRRPGGGKTGERTGNEGGRAVTMPGNWEQETILVVEDEPRTLARLHRILETWAAGRYRVEDAPNLPEALARALQPDVVLLVCDIRIPGGTGLELIGELRKRGRQPAVVLVSGYAEFEYARQAITLEVADYLLKPVEREKLVEAVEKALEARRRNRRISLVEQMADDRLLELERRAPANPAVREAIAYVEAHLGEAIGLKEAAALVHMNASYFSALFKEQCGMTFSEFLTRKRVAKAKELLLTTNLSVEEIAARVGYQTARYFVEVFKEQVGLSPHRYRKWANENGL